MIKKTDISIIIPVFNEERNVFPLIREISNVLEKSKIQAEVIFVNDGSTDQTWNEIKKQHEKNSSITGISLRTRMGKAVALQTGFKYAQTDFLITMDGDLQDDPREIPRFLKKLHQGFELVNGWKTHRKDPLSKTFPSKIFNTVTGMVTGVHLHDMNCGFKGYTRELALSLNLHGEMHRFIPVMAKARGYSLYELPVHHRPRKFEKSKYSWPRFFYGFFDLLTVMYLIKFQSRPLHVFGFVGLSLFSTGTLISLYLSLDKLFFGVTIGDRPLLLMGVLFIIVGLQVVTFGLLGEQMTNQSNMKLTSEIKSIISSKVQSH